MLRYLLLPVACAAALTAALPPSALAQTASAPAADDEALRNIQSNFARMAPPPRTMQSINQDLQQHRRPSGKRPDGAPGRGRKPPPDSANADGKPPAPPDGPPPSDAPPPDGPPSATNP
ncbi:signal peptidase [Ralstonia pseudosolanacearum]|uniref:signal peptidase n=1 Tax=Ralstonia pseudosolanacearum TaxID=1310165 RepID=UPI002676EE2B|nr:signal peptidase [Ralstonia pseudosolanacearum]MDO3508890.1 signal peptidase [Ralstonia pseudosolanacearum]MDO3514164.1 signal peptidase [Ralstonia pseudosolanacearum]MDO3538992.1 signal peptidase [Ralstonia pseudosolanacearum]MDO3607052.1 signal peptidase [Ralstonia pseudosolanacearum]MDO3612800.1 signal peptidase [Ralstonia pseudosolanacearum]